MEQDLNVHRQSRTAQFLAWWRGDQAQTQQQRQQSDRQVADGYTRGTEDPDARSSASRSSAQAFAPQREQERSVRQQYTRPVGDDGPQDVRRAVEGGPRPGSLEAAQNQNRLDDAMRREEALEMQAEGLREAAQRRYEAQQRGRGASPAQTANDSRFAATEVAKRLREAQERSQNRQQGRGR